MIRATFTGDHKIYINDLGRCVSVQNGKKLFPILDSLLPKDIWHDFVLTAKQVERIQKKQGNIKRLEMWCYQDENGNCTYSLLKR